METTEPKTTSTSCCCELENDTAERTAGGNISVRRPNLGRDSDSTCINGIVSAWTCAQTMPYTCTSDPGLHEGTMGTSSHHLKCRFTNLPDSDGFESSMSTACSVNTCNSHNNNNYTCLHINPTNTPCEKANGRLSNSCSFKHPRNINATPPCELWVAVTFIYSLLLRLFKGAYWRKMLLPVHFSPWKSVVLLTTFLLLFVTGVSCDLCENYDKESMEQAVHQSTVPKAGSKAGHYVKVPKAMDLKDCILACCSKPTCNVVFLHNRTCYTVQCDQSNSHSCDPLTTKKDKYAQSYFVQLRSIEETRSLGHDHETSGDSGLVEECSILEDKCPAHEECSMEFTTTGIGYQCVCKRGYSRDPLSKLCTEPADVVDPAARKSCEYGLVGECPTHEECVLRESSKSRVGKCECQSGFSRNSGTGKCEQSDKEVVPSQLSEDTKKMSPEKKDSEKPLTTTATTTTTAKPKLIELTVSAGDNKEIQLPENAVSLTAFTIPKAEKVEEYHYEWSLLSAPEGAEKGAMADKNTDVLKLTNLIAGLYSFKIQVMGPNKFGEGFVNVTVMPPARKNTPPVAIIKPKSQSVVLPKSAILDGSDSTDDDKVVSYHWEEVSGPLQGHQTSSEEAMLQVTDLRPGNYTFKLTVTDSDGVTNSSLANVMVIKETDYPPKSYPGSDVIISLPNNQVTLYGNASSDDKGIVQYEWLKSGGDTLTANMVGVRNPILRLSELQEGDYTFSLKVTDTAGQTDTKEVNVFVKPATNHAPVANAGLRQTVSLPLDSLVLDGRNSTDDKKITKYLWQQLGGPTDLTIKSGDRDMATAVGVVVKGEYSFKLTVSDMESMESSAQVNILVKENENKAPVANAGGDQTIQLPQILVTVNGSQSTDDYNIVTYLWTRDPQSLAAGDVLNNSDHKAVLQLVNLVQGRYVFILQVTDAQGLSTTDTTSIIVKPDRHVLDELELHLQADLAMFTEDNKKNLEEQLALLMHKSNVEGETKVRISKLVEDQTTGHLLIRFYVLTVTKEQTQIRKGTETVNAMKDIISSQASILDYKMIKVDTVVCQNNCSGHGRCDQFTKRCVCEAFWMENFVRASLGPRANNCDWSILYVVIVIFLLVVSVAGMTWLFICCCKRKSRWRCFKSKRRHRYSLLHEVDDKEEIGMIPKAAKIQQASLMVSESDFSSEEETLFVSQKKANGHLPKQPLNGLTKSHMKNKAKA